LSILFYKIYEFKERQHYDILRKFDIFLSHFDLSKLPQTSKMELQVVVDAGTANGCRALLSLRTMQDAKWAAGEVLALERITATRSESPSNCALVVAWPSASVQPGTVLLQSSHTLRALGVMDSTAGDAIRVRCSVLCGAVAVDAEK
jgi:hypothetical protein